MRHNHCDCLCHQTPAVQVTSDDHSKTPPASPCSDRCQRCGGTPRTACPPPPIPCHDGTVQLPPHAPPPVVKPQSPDDGTRPKKGAPGESGWFGKKIKEISRNGPTFGRRKDEYLPLLLMRSNPGDRGARPVPGIFWESPDIFVTAETPPSAAPLIPKNTGGVAKVGTPTTLYAHVWNRGRAPVWGAFVEFYWFNPSLGITYAHANRIGSAMIDLGDRFTSFPEWREAQGPAGDRYVTRGCHAIVRCPNAWVPTWENGGHECLVVRVFEPFMDAVAPTSFDARQDRHIGQRNIAVVPAHSPASIDLMLDIAPSQVPGHADVEVSVDALDTMPWLQLYIGPHGKALKPASNRVSAGLLPPTVAGARRVEVTKLGPETMASMLRDRERFDLGCDALQIGFHATADIGDGEAHVLRVRQRTDGILVGGYTVVLVKNLEIPV